MLLDRRRNSNWRCEYVGSEDVQEYLLPLLKRDDGVEESTRGLLRHGSWDPSHIGLL